MVNLEGVHCEKQEGGCQKNAMVGVQYSWEASDAGPVGAA